MTAPLPTASSPSRGVVRAADLVAVRERMVAASLPDEDAGLVDVLRALEELKAAAAAVQVRAVLALDASVRQQEASAGLRAEKRGRDVPSRVGLALRESPAQASSFLGAARAWRDEMPHTFAALSAGRLSAWRATVMVRETAHLPVEARAVLDRELCADPRVLEGLGTAALTARAKKRAAELDPAACAARARRAAGERAVWIRPAPDTMTYVTALLPVAQGVGVFAALRVAADAARATGDERSRGQVMADTLVERVTGQASAEDVPVMVNLVVSDATLLGAGHEPGVIVADAGPGGGVVPAQVARNLVAHGLDADAAWLRRIYADPGGNLIAASSVARFFGDGLAALLRVRDQGICRTAWCDAPVRHLDHVMPAADGGTTTLGNGQGLCEACNQAKNTGALRQHVLADTVADDAAADSARHTVLTTTPTGHTYRSTAPPSPRPAAPAAVPRLAGPVLNDDVRRTAGTGVVIRRRRRRALRAVTRPLPTRPRGSGRAMPSPFEQAFAVQLATRRAGS